MVATGTTGTNKGWLQQGALPHILFFTVLAVLALTFYSDTIGLLPVGIHDWAQGDRLALAISFYDRGMNFFLPATLNLESVDGITGVEFPLQSYLAAALAHIFGRNSISVCFRVLDIAICWGGLYALFRAVFDRSRNFIASIVPPFLIYCSPIFVVYGGNYMPDPAAVSLCFAGFYFFLRYTDTRSMKALRWSIFLLTLALLMKASTISYIATVLAVAFVREAFFNRSAKRAIAIAAFGLISAALFLAQFFYTNYLNETYNSYLFTATAHPFESMERFQDFIGFPFKETWLGEYFLLAEYPILILLIAAGIGAGSVHKDRPSYLQPVPYFLIGALLMFFMFGGQLTVHDYYMLAIFFPLIGYLLTVGMIRLAERYPVPWPRPANSGILAAVVLIYCLADHQIYRRNNLLGRYENPPSVWLKGGAAILDSLQVPRHAPILIAGMAPPNLGLVYFDRRGYVLDGDYFQDHLSAGTKKLQEKGVRYLIMRASSLDAIRSKADSAELNAQYRILYRDDQKAVLMWKQ